VHKEKQSETRLKTERPAMHRKAAEQKLEREKEKE